MAKDMPKSVKEAIKGLRFKTNQVMEDKESKKKTYAPSVRPMTDEDVLSWKYVGDTLTIVSKDGTKHRVECADVEEKKDDKK